MKLSTVFTKVMKILEKRIYLYLGAIIVMTMSNALFKVVSSFLLKGIIEIAQNSQVSKLPALIGSNIAIGLVALILWRYSCIIYNVEAKRGIANLEKIVFLKAMKLPMPYYENHHSGDFISKLVYDTNRVGDIFGSRLRRLAAPILQVIVYLVPMFYLSPEITLCLIGVNLVALLFNTSLSKPMKRIGTEMSKKYAHLTEGLSNLLQGIEMTKVFDARQAITEKCKVSNKECAVSQKKKNLASACLESMNTGFDLICALAFLGLGVYYIEKGSITLGALAAIYSMYGSLSWNFLQIGRYIPEFINCLSNGQRIFEFLDEKEEPENYNIGSATGKGYIEFENVTFGYNEERKILDSFSMSVEKGSSVAITGPSGRGKSTLAKILLGFYEPAEGKISIDGKALSDMTLLELRNKIAYVPQEPYIYNVSIKDNIAYGKENATEEEIITAAKAANAHEFILRLENGYDNIPGERGGKLSGGEKQRIAIARAILKNAPILLLDEATSALDNESERLVQEAIDNLMKNRTTIMIAHRPSTISSADRQIAM
jgi:ATP-binding cassette subfamily B protein